MPAALVLMAALHALAAAPAVTPPATRPVLAIAAPVAAPHLAVASAGPALAAGSSADTARIAGWREDLRFLTTMVRAIHPRPFARLPEAAFDSAAASLEGRLPALSDAEVAVDLMRLMASLEDGHSGLMATSPVYGFDAWLPLRIESFDDGLRVIAAPREHARHLGARVVRIGALPAEEALERVQGMVSGDNDYSRLDRATLFLMMPRVLQVLGIAPAVDAVRYEVEDAGGGRASFEVKAVPSRGHPEWYFSGEGVPVEGFRVARDTSAAAAPLHLRQPERPWWFTWLPEPRVVYFQFRSVDPADADETFSRFCARLFAFTDSVRARALVIDLRHNGGGNNTILQPLIHGLIRRDTSVNQPGRLYAVIGRTTFSAAMNCANWLEEHTRVTFVGEPTGGRPNHYGDNRRLPLPNSKLTLLVSQWPWQARLPWDDRPWIAPQLAAPPRFAAWSANRDPALEAILAELRAGPWTERLRALALAGDETALAAALSEHRAAFPDRWGRTCERDLRDLAQALADAGQARAAVAVARLGTVAYPRSASAWTALGEAHRRADQREPAIAAFRRALELDPNQRFARVMLERLGAR
jgi:hypothetical protein